MVTITPSERFTPYAPVVPTTVFPVDFPIFDPDDVKLFLDGEEVTGITVTATFIEGVSTNAVINVMGSGITGEVIVVGVRVPRRTDQYQTGRPLAMDDHNYSLNRLTIENQEQRRDLERSVKSAIGEPGIVISPGPAGSVPAFDGDGNLKDHVSAQSIIDAETIAEEIREMLDEATQLATPGDGTVTDLKLNILSNVYNRAADWCDIRDYNQNGSVDGNNATRFTEAWEAAYADNIGKDVTVHIPSKSPNGLPWLLESVVLGDPLTNSQGKVTFKGDGRWTKIKPAAPMDYLIRQCASMNTLENLMIDDTDNSWIGGAAIYASKAQMDGLPQYFTSIFGLGCERLFRNDVADAGHYYDIQALNCRRPMDFNSGGVSARMNKLKFQGFEVGIVLNSDIATDANRIHSEELTITNFELLGGSAYPNAIGVWARDSLLLRMAYGVIGQMGPDARGIFFDGTTLGNAYARLNQVWCDIGNGGWAFYLDGVNNGHEFFQCDASYGGAGISNGAINGWFIQNAAKFLIKGGRIADPTGLKFNNAVLAVGSSGTIQDTNFDDGGTLSESSCSIVWDTDRVPTGRLTTSEYPRAGWTSYAGVASNSGGPLTAASVVSRYQKKGKTNKLAGTVAITTNGGTTTGFVFVNAPIPAKVLPNMYWTGRAREMGTSNKPLLCRIGSGGTQIDIIDTGNGYAGSDGGFITFEIEYEID